MINKRLGTIACSSYPTRSGSSTYRANPAGTEWPVAIMQYTSRRDRFAVHLRQALD